MTERTVVYCGTRNLYHQIATVAKSVFLHDAADRVVVLAEDDSLYEYVPDCVRVLNVSGQRFFPCDGPNYHQKFTYMALMRTALTKILPECDTVLSLDADTIVHRSIDELWSLDLFGYCVAAVPEPRHLSEAALKHWDGETYFNSGVMLMNLAGMRDGTDDALIRCLNTTRMKWPEQDAINRLCNGKIYPLAPQYNTIRFFYPDIPKHEIRIRHYVHNIPPIEHEFDFRKLERMTWSAALAAQKRR